jgi:RNA polymerase sigma-70 factor (ECF subfamily)
VEPLPEVIPVPLHPEPGPKADVDTRDTGSGAGVACGLPGGDLVARLRAGDEQAFRDLVRAWSPGMLRIAGAHVRTAQAAEDVVQETWVAVIRGLRAFEGRSSLRTWAFTILVNRARTHGAKEARTLPYAPVREEDEPAVDPDRFQGPDGQYPGHWTSLGAPTAWRGDPERRALDGEARQLIEDALSGLPQRQRVAVTLRDVLGLDSDEACAVLGVSPQNQRVLLHRGRAALRAALEGYYGG